MVLTRRPPPVRRADDGAGWPAAPVRPSAWYGTPAPAEAPPEESLTIAKFHAPEIMFGEGALAEAGHAALRLGARRPMLVTDAGLMATPWVEELAGHLRAAGLSPTVWAEPTPNPKDHEIAAGYECYREAGCDVLIGLGGGSVIDAAKGVALLAANGGDILEFEGVDRSRQPIPPMVMIPSTAGTGADVSQFCIVTDTRRNTKITIIGRTLVPEVSVTDPRLLTTMPDWLAAATGLDALTHGIEAFVSKAHNPLTDHHALNSIALVNGNLVRSIDCRAERSPRLLMAQASLEAGLAFTNAILGAAHAMSHQVGGLLDLPHGVVNGVLLPHVVRFNARARPERYVPVARALGVADERTPATAAGMAVADQVRALADEVGVPKTLGELGVTAAHVPVLARTTLHDACLATNPRAATADEIETLFRAAL
ncbi:iron-containing alcohol dehydrogenase [Amycolatopsis ultiminotia]|uniref:Iron-containing alcohol dehydrogenase n=1 Tax=Amycolatopsis ultiminotia TaxID=543629 RepID=A0ABP6VBV2_9PSEU